MNMLISVIIPVYKVEQYLNQCIDSIVSQTYKNIEIILVDDGSPDNCPYICDDWKRKDPRVKVIHKKNGGLSDARNAGLDLASGDFIGFVDSDDWIEPDMYEKLLKVLIDENADISSCGTIDSYDNSERNRSFPYSVGGSELFLKMIYKDTTFPVSTWNKLYRKKCWETLRFPLGKICEDAFTTYLLVDNANKIVQIPDLLYHYRIRENSIMTSNFRHSRMDEEEAWRRNYQYVQTKYPNIGKYAYDFYLQKVYMLLNLIRAEQNGAFVDEYRFLKRIIQDNYFYIIFKSTLSMKFRLRFILNYFNL